MNGILMYASWLAGPVLQITLLLFMIQRKLHGVFPRFFSYIVFQIVKSGILFVVYRYSHDNYFDAYWAGNAISVLLGVAVMDEILQHLLKQYGGIQKLASIIFRWACGLLLLLSIVNAFSTAADQCRQGGVSGAGVRSQRAPDAMWALHPLAGSLPASQKLLAATRIRNCAGIRNLCLH